MPVSFPYIPETITVHLGRPTEDAANVTVSFVDYVKNVASSEIYPTWNESALRANILAITSFALNRVYTEFYRSRHYAFDITNSTAFDMAFVNGRNIFDNISQLVDEMFNDYLRRQGFLEPLAASFCNGTTVTCDGLSQWGSENLAAQGYNSVEIIHSYYGEDVEIVYDAPLKNIEPSYPGTPLRQGDTGPNVSFIQTSLNRISQNYPAITKISPVNGTFDATTAAAVRTFQQIFELTVDGIVGKATWYAIIRLYVAILRLAELNSEGQTFDNISWAYPDAIVEGNSGQKVSHLQYMLAVLSQFYPTIPPLTLTGTFDEATKNAVLAFQLMAGLPQNGEVGAVTWDAIYDAYAGIAATVLSSNALFPYQDTPFPAMTMRDLQQQLSTVADATPGMTRPSVTGRPDTLTRQSLRQFQTLTGLPSSGQSDERTKSVLAANVGELRYAKTSRFTQFPGYDLRLGMTDFKKEGR